MQHRQQFFVAALAAAALTSGCGDDLDKVAVGSGPGVEPAGASRPAASGEPVTATGTVLESPQHGPEFCQFVAESYPPQCGGLALVGFSWDDVEDEQSEAGTTWGTYTVTGVYRDGALELTGPATASVPQADSEPSEFLPGTPCPQDGWRTGEGLPNVEDAARVGAYAEAQPDYAATWIDQLVDWDGTGEMPDGVNRDVVLNVSFTGDLERHEAELRKLWAGNLCVSEAPRSAAELESLQERLAEEFGADERAHEMVTSMSVDPRRGVVVIDVLIDDGFSAAAAERFGEGLVEIRSVFRPAN